MAIAGESKTLKTTIALDMSVALAAGVSFLGSFAAAARKRVIVVADSIWRPEIHHTFHNILASKGLKTADLGNYWSVSFGRNFHDIHRTDETVISIIEKHQPEVLIIDPLMMAASVSPSTITKCLDAGTLLVLVLPKPILSPTQSRSQLYRPALAAACRQQLWLSHQQPFYTPTAKASLAMVRKFDGNVIDQWSVKIKQAGFADRPSGRGYAASAIVNLRTP